jgi:hypothetical protein
MSKFQKQAQATRYISNLLTSRRIDIKPGIVLIGEDEPWQVFEQDGRCIGIDTGGSVWIGMSGEKWQSLGSCTVSSALEAVEFLIND